MERNSRKYFIDDRVKKGLLEPHDISEKTLANIENGYTLPSLITLNYLSTALELDLLDLIREIREYIPDH